MSELAERIPSFTPIDAELGATQNHEQVPTIDFKTIASMLSAIGTDLEYRDCGRYQQELDFTATALARLDLARDYLDDRDYGGCRWQFEAIMDLVRPTGNEVLIEALQQEHDKLYIPTI